MITVFGTSGVIGSHIARYLSRANYDVYAPDRNVKLKRRDLGNVIYCIGITSDFRTRPYDTVEAHVSVLSHILQTCTFNSFTYLSSTRIYKQSESFAKENDAILVHPLKSDDLYNISKIMGESLLISSGKQVKIIRLSNVYGGDYTSDNFLPSLIRDAIKEGKIILRTSPQTAKDYIGIQDVVDLVCRITIDGKHNVYNVASGFNVSHASLMKIIEKQTGCKVEIDPGGDIIPFPTICIERIESEFGYIPTSVLSELPLLIDEFKRLKGEEF
ncbi:NAD-dependent epimerase/dehydratase family protein [Thermodesulfobacteriota bacterium]